MAEAEFLTLYILCAKTFVYTWNDDVFTIFIPKVILMDEGRLILQNIVL